MISAVAGSYPDDAAIARLFDGFANRTLPAAEWTHGAHFAVALWLIGRWPEIEVEARLPGMIRSYNESLGNVNTADAGYHETITIASIQAARHHLSIAEPDSPIYRVHNALMSGPCGQSSWLSAYWSNDLLMSPSARADWVEPDLKPLMF